MKKRSLVDNLKTVLAQATIEADALDLRVESLKVQTKKAEHELGATKRIEKQVQTLLDSVE